MNSELEVRSSAILDDGPIELASMRQLKDAKDLDDDWTGVTTKVERRKRQNRLNQRAYSEQIPAELALTNPLSYAFMPIQLSLPLIAPPRVMLFFVSIIPFADFS